jgi:AcrB/AcrD/AcrF family
MFTSLKWALLILTNVAMAPLGSLLALLVTHTNLSVSSGVGFLALFGVSVQTGVIMVEYINQLRARGYTIEQSAEEGAVLRLRPIMMTMLVATLAWNRIRFAAPVCHRDRRRTPFEPRARHLSLAHALRLVCARRRSAPRSGFRSGCIGFTGMVIRPQRRLQRN